MRRIAGPSWLDARIARGEVVILDGATGSELQRRGVPMDPVAWSGPCVLEHGEALRGVHEDYIRAGAEVIMTNTFSTARHMLEPAGYGAEVAEINRRAVALALEARDRVAGREVAVAGSIANFVADERDPHWLSPDILRATFEEQAQLLAEAGVELIVLEMLQKAEMAAIATEAAVATGLPVWAGLSCRRPHDGGELRAFDYPERSFEEVVRAVAGQPVAAVTVMHSELPDTGPGLELVRRHWAGVTGAYPNSGYFARPNWVFVEQTSPDELLTAARGWVATGAQLIGGCCGLGPRHVEALAAQLGAIAGR